MKIIKKNNGFTLIEILVVVVIISLITNMAVVNFKGKTDEAKETVNQGNMVNIMTAIELYEMDNGFYPDDTSENPLKILLGDEDEAGYLRMKSDDLEKYEYILSADKKSYTINIKES